jgi:hypothetical protein
MFVNASARALFSTGSSEICPYRVPRGGVYTRHPQVPCTSHRVAAICEHQLLFALFGATRR